MKNTCFALLVFALLLFSTLGEARERGDQYVLRVYRIDGVAIDDGVGRESFTLEPSGNYSYSNGDDYADYVGTYDWQCIRRTDCEEITSNAIYFTGPIQDYGYGKPESEKLESITFEPLMSSKKIIKVFELYKDDPKFRPWPFDGLFK